MSRASKSTPARSLETRLSLPFAATDDLYWGPNWQLVSSEALREGLIELARADSWVLHSNFADVRDIDGIRADTLVWLGYPTLRDSAEACGAPSSSIYPDKRSGRGTA